MAHIFLRGFDWGTPETKIRAHCAKAGKVTDFEFWGDGAARITFATPAAAQQAVEMLNGTTIAGNSRYVDVKIDDKPPVPGAPKRQRQAEVPAGGGNVYVRGFDFGTTDEQFEAHMGQAGTIVGVKWSSKGAANVFYKTKAEANTAVTLLNQTVIPGNSRYIDVLLKEDGDWSGQSAAKRQKYGAPASMASPWMMAMASGWSKGGFKGPAKGMSKGGKSNMVFVRGFDFGTTDEQVGMHLGQAGTIVDVKWISKGSAEIVYSSLAEAKLAVATLNGTIIPGNSRYIEVIQKE